MLLHQIYTTNTNLLEFAADPGDTITSNFIIYNTGGSDLVVEISDGLQTKPQKDYLVSGII